MNYRGVLFDLDGTLLDTVSALSQSMNEILTRYHLPTHPTEDYKAYIGNGIKALVEQAAPPGTDPQLLETMYREKSALYQQYWKQGTTLFPGIKTMLDELTYKHVMMAIVSSKEDYFTQQIVNYFLGQWDFVAVTGRSDKIPKKPDPTAVLSIIQQSSLPPEQWVLVGDKDTDYETATNAGIHCLWASWGYQRYPPKDALPLRTPLDIITYV